jgi:hypothetical protein
MTLSGRSVLRPLGIGTGLSIRRIATCPYDFNGKEPPDGGSRRDAVATLSYGYEEGCHSVGNFTAIFHWQHLLFRGMARCG